MWLVTLFQYGSISMKTETVLLYKNHSYHMKRNETLFILQPYMNDMCYVSYLQTKTNAQSPQRDPTTNHPRILPQPKLMKKMNLLGFFTDQRGRVTYNWGTPGESAIQIMAQESRFRLPKYSSTTWQQFLEPFIVNRIIN